MKVKNLIKSLECYDPDTVVEVCVKVSDGDLYSQGGVYAIKELKDSHFDFVDFKDNKFTKPGDEHYNKSYLTLGGDCE